MWKFKIVFKFTLALLCRLFEEAAESLHQLADKLPPPGNK